MAREFRLRWALAHLRPRRVRMRLTLLYGLLFVMSGAVLLGITYLLVTNSPKSNFNVFTRGPGGPIVNGAPAEDPATRLDGIGDQLREQATRQHEAELHHLLVQSGIALAIMALISVGLGWLVAGRVLRPLRTMTDSIQQISARNLHERLAAQGPGDEMKELSDTVDGLLERLESALDAHKRFIANAAHEMRTPLTLQHALLEETLTDRDGTLASFQATFQQLLVIGQQQGRLLEALLTLASSERGLDRRDSVDLAAVASQVVHASRPAADDHDLRLQTRIAPAQLSGDPILVERLVANLVDNAVGYNTPGGQVDVTVSTISGNAVVAVANTGPTVPADQILRLFQPFQRLDRTIGRQRHHGLGLSIVRAIATAHDATIAAEAHPHGGLTVAVTFPPSRPAGPDLSPSAGIRLPAVPRPA